MKKILFLGGAYSQIPIIKEAKSRGWYIVTCDYLPDNPGHKLADQYYNISTTDFEEVLNLAKDIRPDYVVAYASDPAAPVAAFVSEKLGLPGNPYESIRTLAEKDLFRNFLHKHGFNAPKAVTINTEDNAIEKIKSLQFPVIIKPTDSSGSKGVTKVKSHLEVPTAVNFAFTFSRNKRLIAEEFIESNGEQFHGDGFVYRGDLIFSYLGDHHYNKKINPFVPYSTSWPSNKPKEYIQLVENEVSKLINQIGYINGPINIEARIDNKGKIFIMEVGPRSGGNFVPQIINYATGFDMVKATLDVLFDKEVQVQTYFSRYTAYYVIHTDIDGTLDTLLIKEDIKPYIKEFHQYINPG